MKVTTEILSLERSAADDFFLVEKLYVSGFMKLELFVIAVVFDEMIVVWNY